MVVNCSNIPLAHTASVLLNEGCIHSKRDEDSIAKRHQKICLNVLRFYCLKNRYSMVNTCVMSFPSTNLQIKEMSNKMLYFYSKSFYYE